MLSLFVACCVLQRLVSADGLLPARSLQVNYISTHEEYELRDRKHLPMIEITSGFNNEFKSPIFSWKLDSKHEIFGDKQTSYIIQLFHETDLTLPNRERTMIFESNKILSNDPFCNLNDIITDQFRDELLSLKWKVLSFRVKWFNSQSIPSEFSRFGRFILTSGSLDDWSNASYIAQQTVDNSEFNERIPLFKTSFSVPTGKTSVKSAVLNIVGLGFFRAWMNHNDLFSIQSPPLQQLPGWTNTEKRVPYVSLDVTSLVNMTSTNEVLIALAVGYRNTTVYAPHDGRSKGDTIDCVLKVNLVITYNDGSNQSIVSDDSWSTAMGATIYSSIYNGETFDENLDESAVWGSVIVMGANDGPPGVLYNSVQPYVTVIGSDKPVQIYDTVDRMSQIVDFGTNTAALVRINVAGLNEGDVIQMKFAEVKQHPSYGAANGDLYYDNLRSAQQFDRFIASGRTLNSKDPVWFEPFFTIHGFQFVEVWGYPTKLTSDDIIRTRVHANVKTRSNWTSSDKALNDVNDRCVNGQLSNLLSVPTDCNQRDERLGWMGDAGLTSNSFAINFDYASFGANYLILMNDELGSDGSLPDVVPYYRYGNRPSDPNWGIAFPQTVNVLNMYYNMSTIVQEYLQTSIPKYIGNLQSRMPKTNGKDNISKYPGSYGDWCPPPPQKKIDNSYAGAFGYIETVRVASALCNVTGNTTYQKQLDALYSTLVSEFIAAFYDSSKGQFVDGQQTSYAMALEAGIYSDANMQASLQSNLLKQIMKDSNLLTVGIIGAKFMFPELSKMKNDSLALQMIKGGQGVNGQLNASYPSWSFEGNNSMEPASAVWELWDGPSEGPGMDSRNHHMFSSVSAYLNTFVSGLHQLKYNEWKISIGHLKYNDLQWSNIDLDDGLISYDWKWNNVNHLDVNIIVPIGHSVELVFDDEMKSKYGCQWSVIDMFVNWGINELTDESFINKYNAKVNDNGNVVVGSGKYQWKLFCLTTFA